MPRVDCEAEKNTLITFDLNRGVYNSSMWRPEHAYNRKYDRASGALSGIILFLLIFRVLCANLFLILCFLHPMAWNFIVLLIAYVYLFFASGASWPDHNRMPHCNILTHLNGNI